MEFVTFDTAKKLKEKNFIEKCLAYYTPYGGILKFNIMNVDMRPSGYEANFTELYECYNYYVENNIDAPTISQALKWLRVNKGVDIAINPIIKYDDNSNRIREYNCDIFAPQLNKPYHTSYHDSYELAALAGIEYALDNII